MGNDQGIGFTCWLGLGGPACPNFEEANTSDAFERRRPHVHARAGPYMVDGKIYGLTEWTCNQLGGTWIFDEAVCVAGPPVPILEPADEGPHVVSFEEQDCRSRDRLYIEYNNTCLEIYDPPADTSEQWKSRSITARNERTDFLKSISGIISETNTTDNIAMTKVQACSAAFLIVVVIMAMVGLTFRWLRRSTKARAPRDIEAFEDNMEINNIKGKNAREGSPSYINMAEDNSA